MSRPTNHTIDYLTTEPVRVAALLRLPLIVLIALLVYIQDVEHWLPGVYGALLLLYAAFAVVWLVIVVRNPVRWWFGVASTGMDVLAVLVLCLASGGATVWLLPIFFMVPITVAFLDRPELTAALGLSAAGGYLMAWIVYSKRDDTWACPTWSTFRSAACCGSRRRPPRCATSVAPPGAGPGAARRAAAAGSRSHAGRRAQQPPAVRTVA